MPQKPYHEKPTLLQVMAWCRQATRHCLRPCWLRCILYDVIRPRSYTVYPKKYTHGFCFAVLCCGDTLTDFPISTRLTSLALWQSNDCPSASKATLMNIDKDFMWIHYERLRNHNKAKHNKTVCIFLGIYCIFNKTNGDKHVQQYLIRKLWDLFITMTSLNGSNFRVTGPLCGEFTGHRWIPLTKVSVCGDLISSLTFAWTNEWTIETLMVWDAIAIIMTSL